MKTRMIAATGTSNMPPPEPHPDRERWMEQHRKMVEHNKQLLAAGAPIMPDMMPFKPMLCHKKNKFESHNEFILRTIGSGVLATPKIDGIRCITHDRGMMENYQTCLTMTRSGRNIPNPYIRKCIEAECPPWLDGELVVGDSFQASTSGIMRRYGAPNFTYYVFDCCINLMGLRYDDRVRSLRGMKDRLPGFVKILDPKWCYTMEELLAYEEEQVQLKAEGVCYRKAGSLYVQKRATRRHPYLCALKRFSDSEAVVIGIEPMMHNDNPIELGPLGQKERSTNKENMVPMPKVGKLLVRDLQTKVEFSVGSGLDDDQRILWWEHPSEIIGKIVKYKSQEHGVKIKPRIPTFLGIRASQDMPPTEPDQQELF